MGKVVLDASALLAFLFKEPGADRVKAVLSDGVMSAVNQSEVIATALRHGGEVPEITAMLAQLLVEILPVDADDAILIASLRPAMKLKGLSLGDRCCLALGMKLGVPVLTADREWAELEIEARVEVIR